MTPAYTAPANKYAEGAHFLIDKGVSSFDLKIADFYAFANLVL